MYSEIADVYHEIFPLNPSFMNFIPPFLGPAGSPIADFGCGPGDYIHALSDTHKGTGIDPDPEMIRLAKTKNKGDFFQMGFADISRLNGPFSCIFSIGNSLSYLPHPEMDIFFAQTHRLLYDNTSHFVFQVVNWDKYKITGQMDFPVKTLSDGRTFHRGYAPGKGETVLFLTRLQKGDTIVGSWADTLYPKYTPALVYALEKSGMTVESIFGDFEKSPFDAPTSPAIVMVAGKSS